MTHPAPHTTSRYGADGSLEEWIVSETAPTLGELTELNFALYERIGLPMFLCFLDLAGGGGGGGDGPAAETNAAVLDALRPVAEELRGRISFAYCDGRRHADRMRVLGLGGGVDSLPAMALNTRDARTVPFPREVPIDRRSVLQFCADFLTGKTQSAADARRNAKTALARSSAGPSATPAARRAAAARGAAPRSRAAPPTEVGISEQFSKSDRGVAVVDAASWARVALDPDRDVLVLFHERGSVPCGHMAVYYKVRWTWRRPRKRRSPLTALPAPHSHSKALAKRFDDLGVPSLVVARYDLSDGTPPPPDLQLAALPAVVLLPARDKGPPYRWFSGVGKALELMRWAHANAAVPFDLPELPHLERDDVGLYKEQLEARERRRRGGEL